MPAGGFHKRELSELLVRKTQGHGGQRLFPSVIGGSWATLIGQNKVKRINHE